MKINQSHSDNLYNDSEVSDLSDTLSDIGLAFLLGALIFITIVGNVLVIIAILMEKNLRTVSNYLVLSLAIADLMVACMVMPLGAVYIVSGGWNLPAELCDVWTSADVLCCTASILHLLAIAIDRYWAVTNINYIHNRSPKRIVTLIAAIWSIAVIISVAPILGWKDPDYERRLAIDKKCLISQDVIYQVVATFATFYGPLVLILLLYWRIYQVSNCFLNAANDLQKSHLRADDYICIKDYCLYDRWFIFASNSSSESDCRVGKLQASI